MFDPNCPLCIHERLTRHYYEDDEMWVCDDTNNRGYAKRILGVWKEHSWDISLPVMARILDKLMEVVNKEYKCIQCCWDENLSLASHWHIQLNIKSFGGSTCQLCGKDC